MDGNNGKSCRASNSREVSEKEREIEIGDKEEIVEPSHEHHCYLLQNVSLEIVEKIFIFRITF